ncbi:MAG: two-component sensor histidine kinase [Rubrivivax sp.]|nr:two-component sensor histidine kinase [Rubrivivax sp.]
MAGALRPSYRQLLVLAFLLVCALLAGAALQGLFTLERLLTQSRSAADNALRLATATERLDEQVLAMERAARQYLVLGDPALRRSFERGAQESAQQVALLADVVERRLARDWRRQTDSIAAQLDQGGLERQLVDDFRVLNSLQATMAEQVRRHTETRNAALQAELEDGRRTLAQQVAAAAALALALALGFAWWLARPLQRVEAAILGLGENRLEEHVQIQGPSDVRRIGRRLDWLRQRLAETEADKARFLRHVSHDLKTPLAALREGVALLADGTAGPLSDNQREIARILQDNSATLQRRIEDLLRWNASAFAAQRVVRQPVELGALLQSLIDEQQLQWRSRGLQLQVRGTPLTAELDPALLGSALGNLLSNAIRFSPRGASIQIEVRREAHTLVLELADAGPGVPAADRAHIFEPFYRGSLQPEDGLPGTGIGLSIVAETVGAHGGRISLLDTEPGARFRIELPHALPD